MEGSSLPVIDFSSPDREATARKLVQAMETVGFVYLDNVPGYNKDVEESLHKAAVWFFSRSLEEKLAVSPKKWNKDAEGVFRGYIPINVDYDFLREQYGTGNDLPEDDPERLSANPLYEPTPWLQGEDGDAFHRLLLSHRKAVSDAGMEFLRLTAMGLGLDEHHFDAQFMPRSLSSLRIMHYPTYGKADKPVFTCEEHFDSTFVTLLVTFSYPGLEVLRENGEWLGVDPRPGSLVVNIGDLLSRMTNRRFKATMHRVRDVGGDRYSVPFFFEPHAYGKFTFPDNGSTITYGPWMVNHVKRFPYQFGQLSETDYFKSI